MNYKDSSEATAKQKYNSIQYELFLWNRVRLMKLNDGTMMFTRARFVEDALFPELFVRGYNEANDCEEEFSLKHSKEKES